MDFTTNAAALTNANRNYGAARQLTTPSTGDADAPKDGGMIAKGVESFSDVLANVETTTTQYAAGTTDAQSVVEALANAEMALETAVTVRNRVVEAYQELLRMPI